MNIVITDYRSDGSVICEDKDSHLVFNLDNMKEFLELEEKEKQEVVR